MKQRGFFVRMLFFVVPLTVLWFSSLSGQGTCIARISGGSANILVSDPAIDVVNYGFVRLRAKVLHDGAGNYAFHLKAPDSVQVHLGVNDTTHSGPFILGAWVGAHICIDDIRVRKFARNEPGYEIGDEQTPPPIDAWFDPDWTCRRPITIDNTLNTDTLYDFQVKMDIPYDADMQPDFDDIRFTSNDSISSLPYWIGECYQGNRALVYVKVPCIPGGDSTYIFMYYGNPSATSESDGYAVFEYFDDFGDGEISDWNIIGGTWTASNRFLEQLETANHRKILAPCANLDASITEATLAYLSTYPYSGNHIFFSTNLNADNGYYFGFDGPGAGKEAVEGKSIQSPSLSVLSANPGNHIRLLLEIPENMYVTGTIHDCSGRTRCSFIPGTKLTAGTHTFTVDTERWSAGIYFISVSLHAHHGSTGCGLYHLSNKVLLIE